MTPSLSGLPRTLLLTLKARADEHHNPAGLFRDPTAAGWIDSLGWPLELDAFYRLGFQTGFAVRTRVFDDAADRFLKAHPAPTVIELAAGLSTRYQRLNPDQVSWYELDFPEVIALRGTLESETDRHRYFSASMFDLAWMDRLSGLSPESCLFIAEGVMVFLDPAEVREWITALRRRFPGATFLLDVAGHALRDRREDAFAGIDAPIRWTVADENEVAALGVELLHVWSMLAQHPARWGDQYRANLTPEQRNSSLLIEARLLPLME